jgi:hypothetical protein
VSAKHFTQRQQTCQGLCTARDAASVPRIIAFTIILRVQHNADCREISHRIWRSVPSLLEALRVKRVYRFGRCSGLALETLAGAYLRRLICLWAFRPFP